MGKSECKYYIGYGSGDTGVLYPDVFCDRPSNMNAYIGKPWGSYVCVAGPFDTQAACRHVVNMAGQSIRTVR